MTAYASVCQLSLINSLYKHIEQDNRHLIQCTTATLNYGYIYLVSIHYEIGHYNIGQNRYLSMGLISLLLSKFILKIILYFIFAFLHVDSKESKKMPKLKNLIQTKLIILFANNI